jgi:cell division protein FtsI (penicillin-binding protein 3)
LFMDPKTGEILAMAYCGKGDGLPVKNRVLSDNFEPGSTFKIITAGAALEEGLLTAADSIFAENGEFWIGKRSIHDIKPLKWLSFKESVVYSSNIALAKTAMMLGKDRLYQYARRFGISQKTGIDLPGEGTGFIPSPKRWPDLVLGCMGFGQGISLTALQLACAYSSVANGGVMMKPYVVKAILDTEGNVIESNHPTMVRRVVSEETASTLIDFMKGVVTSGSGQKAQMDGLTIGGKTGTAQRAKPGGGGYEEGKYIASFIGLFPAEDPWMVGLITLDNPTKEHLGGQTAAPVFKNATQRIVSLSGETILANSVSEKQPEETTEEKPENIRSEPDLPRLDLFDLFSYQEQLPESTILVPDVRGLTLREAVKIFSSRDLRWKLKGSGIVVNQIPKPDTLVNRNIEFLLECQPD